MDAQKSSVVVGVLLLLGAGVYILMKANSQSTSGGDSSSSSPFIDPNDQSTWPTGDGIWDICQAIAIQEGYSVSGSRPQRNHNPGDISDGANQFGKDSGGLTTFPDDQTGWSWLYNKVSNIVSGNSNVYPSDMSIYNVGLTWADGDVNWGINVAANLGVDPNSTFSDYIG